MPDAQVTRTNSLETVRNMVASGLGVSVLPRDALTPKYHSKLVVPVPFTQPTPTRRVALAYRKSFPRPAAIAALRDAVAVSPSPKSGARVRAPRSGLCALRPRGMAHDRRVGCVRARTKKEGLHLRVTPWFIWWAILGSNQ